MNSKKISLIIFLNLFLFIQGFSLFSDQTVSNGWKTENWKSPTIKRLARNVVKKYNTLNNANYEFRSINKAKSEVTARGVKAKHYVMSIKAFKNPCTERPSKCFIDLYATVYGNINELQNMEINVRPLAQSEKL